MKKWIMILIMLPMFSTGAFAASSVSEAIDDMIIQDEDILILTGDLANNNDILAAIDIITWLNETKSKEASLKLANEVSSISQPTILIGGPCANTFTEEVMVSCDAWPYQPGQGIISSYDHNGQTVIVAAGTLEGDTRSLGKEFQNYEISSNLQASTTALFGKAEVGVCGNAICDTGETDQNCIADCSVERSVKLVSTLGHKHSPRISGNNIVWTRAHAGVDIRLYEGDTGRVVRVSDGNFAAIDGDYIIDNNHNVYHIPTGQKTNISGESIGEAPAIYDGKVVFAQGADVYMHNLNTNQKTKLFTATRPGGLSMYDNRVVYTDDIDAMSYDIYIYNIQTGQEIRLETGGAQYGPDIYGNTVVWEDTRGGDRDVYAYDISANQEWRVTSSLSNQIWPMIDGDIITWVDNRNGNEDVYYCDLSKNGLDGGCLANDKKTRVTYKTIHQGTADVSNNVLVWLEEKTTLNPGQITPTGRASSDDNVPVPVPMEGLSDKDVVVFQIPTGGLPPGFVIPS
jgi:beta propeller repeat protein